METGSSGDREGSRGGWNTPLSNGSTIGPPVPKSDTNSNNNNSNNNKYVHMSAPTHTAKATTGGRPGPVKVNKSTRNFTPERGGRETAKKILGTSIRP